MSDELHTALVTAVGGAVRMVLENRDLDSPRIQN